MHALCVIATAGAVGTLGVFAWATVRRYTGGGP